MGRSGYNGDSGYGEESGYGGDDVHDDDIDKTDRRDSPSSRVTGSGTGPDSVPADTGQGMASNSLGEKARERVIHQAFLSLLASLADRFYRHPGRKRYPPKAKSFEGTEYLQRDTTYPGCALAKRA